MNYYRTSKGRIGQKTRGLTCENRLRQTDVFICMEYDWLIRKENAIFIDLGFGRYPTTTIETHRRLSAINQKAKVIGVEIDTERLLEAKRYEQPNVEFRLGGFNLPLKKDEFSTIIRCYNVLRQYPEEEFESAIKTMCHYLTKDGVILEGTSDQFGRLTAFNIFGRSNDDIVKHGLVFGTNFNLPFHPRDFQSVLPRNFIQHVVQGEWIHQFFDDWTACFYKVMSLRIPSKRQIFYETAIVLHNEYGYNINQTERLLKRGFLVVIPFSIFNSALY
jgi:hypothetical protein